MAQVSLGSFLNKVCALSSDKEKIEALKQNDSFVLRTVLQGAFDPRIKWALPPGIPPYNQNPMNQQGHVLIKEINKKNFALYLQGFYPKMKQSKRESLFISLLERVAGEDALLLCSVKDKKLPTEGLTEELVKKALPGLF